MSLQGVYPLTEPKHKMWLTKDNNSTKLTQLAQDRNGTQGIALEPLRIRTFYITYNIPTSSSKADAPNHEGKNADSDSSFIAKNGTLNAENSNK